MLKKMTILVFCSVVALFTFFFLSNTALFGNSELEKKVAVVERKMKNLYGKRFDKSYVIAKSIVKHADANALSYDNVIAIAWVESTFNHKAVSETNDIGLMQVNWNYHGYKYCKNKKELLGIDKNIEVACKILSRNRRLGYKNTASYHSLSKTESREDYEKKIIAAIAKMNLTKGKEIA